MPRLTLRLGVLRQLSQPDEHLVLDARLRQPGEGSGLPPASAAGPGDPVTRPALYYDLGSPYAYLAYARAAVWAQRERRGREFAEHAFRASYGGGGARLSDAAIRLGVVGVPTVQVGDELFYGDDRLERAADHWAKKRASASATASGWSSGTK
jgi:hypothetical protein